MMQAVRLCRPTCTGIIIDMNFYLLDIVKLYIISVCFIIYI